MSHFDIPFEDCGLRFPNGKEVGSFDGIAHFYEDSGMAILGDIELREFDPKARKFTTKMLNRFDPTELWMLNALTPSIRDNNAEEIQDQLEMIARDRRTYAGVDEYLDRRKHAFVE